MYRGPAAGYIMNIEHMLAESISWNLFLGSLNVYKYGLWRRKDMA
jgi:hypothetical protein